MIIVVVVVVIVIIIIILLILILVLVDINFIFLCLIRHHLIDFLIHSYPQIGGYNWCLDACQQALRATRICFRIVGSWALGQGPAMGPGPWVRGPNLEKLKKKKFFFLMGSAIQDF